MQIENAYKSDSFDNILVTGLKSDIWCKTGTRVRFVRFVTNGQQDPRFRLGRGKNLDHAFSGTLSNSTQAHRQRLTRLS